MRELNSVFSAVPIFCIVKEGDVEHKILFPKTTTFLLKLIFKSRELNDMLNHTLVLEDFTAYFVLMKHQKDAAHM